MAKMTTDITALPLAVMFLSVYGVGYIDLGERYLTPEFSGTPQEQFGVLWKNAASQKTRVS